jgi:hypothetical protein
VDYKITFTDATKATFAVKPYTANGPKEPGAPTPLYSSAVSANTSLVLLGKGAFDYGEPIQKNMVHLLENFANKFRPAYPIQGQLWYKNAAVGDPSWPTDPVQKGLYIYTNPTWSQVLISGEPAQSDLDMANHAIYNLSDLTGTNLKQAVNMQSGDARYVNVSGDSMAGPLSMSSNRIANVGDAIDYYDAVSMSFGDSRYLRLAGGSMQGPVDMSNFRITNVADAIAPQDALNVRSAQALFVQAGSGGAIDGGTY